MAVLARRVSARLSRSDSGAASAPVGTAGVPSWEQIVTDHSARVYRLAYRLTGNQHEAEDLTQDVFVRVFRSLDGYTPDNFEGWLHRITTNLFLDKVRRKARVRFDALSDEAAARLVSSGTVPDRQVVDVLFDDDVERALADLPRSSAPPSCSVTSKA
jgi:RNA polymerase sigma-70 factor (ECF subfamily)